MKGSERRKWERMQNRQAEASGREFKVYEENLERIVKFKYLGRVLREDDDNTKTIANN